MSGGHICPSIKLDILHPDYLCDLMKKMHGLETYGNKSLITSSLRNDSTIQDIPDSQRDRIRRLLNEAVKSRFGSSGRGLSSSVQEELNTLEKKKRIAQSVFDEMVQYGKRLLECIRILRDVNNEVLTVPSLKSNSIIKGMFKDIPSLFQLHEHLTKSFESCSIGSIVLPSAFTSDKETQILNIYKSFLCRYALNFRPFSELYSTNEELQDICKGIVSKSQYEEQRIQNVPGMFYGVSTALPRFKDLIYRLKGALLPNDPEYANITKAWKFIKDLLDRSEQEVILQEKMLKAREALGKLDGLRVKYIQIPLLHLEGPAKKLPRRSIHRRLLDRYLFLFSEYLVMTEPANAVGRYQVKSEIRLTGMTLCEVKDDEEINVDHCFRIKAKELCVELAFSSENEKLLWWNELQQAIDCECNKPNSNSYDEKKTLLNTNNLGEVAAQWVKDESSTMCTNCCTEFTTINRRHHCRACGKLFCGSCSAYKAPLASCGGKYQRVCVVDYYLINKDAKPPTPEIMEAILRRTDKTSQPVRTGFLMWSHFVSNSWSAKPSIRLPKSSVEYRSINRNSEKRKETLREIHLVDSLDSNSSANDVSSQNGPSEGESQQASFSSSSNVSQPMESVNLESSVNSKSSTSSSACLTRLFCVLQTDTSFSFYAARADTRAVNKITVIGLRLFYLDEDSPNKPSDDVNISANQSLPCGKSHSFDNSSPLLMNTEALVDPVKLSKGDCPNFSRQGNPIYRNFKPPPHARNILGHNTSVESSNLSLIATLSKSLTHTHVKSLSELALSSRLSNRSTQSCRERLSTENHENSSQKTSENQDIAANGTLTDKDIVKHLDSVSPEILSLLRNNLGFLLLPLNTDRPAHYFEAATVEIRTQWINSIRRVCVDFMS